LRSTSFQRMISTLPGPLLFLLRLDVDKNYVMGFSSGDYIYYMASGNAQSLGQMRGGSLIGSGVFMFYWWGYPLVMIVAGIAFFFTGDVLTRRISPQGAGASWVEERNWLLLSPFVLMWGYDLVFIFNTESLMDYPGILLRG